MTKQIKQIFESVSENILAAIVVGLAGSLMSYLIYLNISIDQIKNAQAATDATVNTTISNDTQHFQDIDTRLTAITTSLSQVVIVRK